MMTRTMGPALTLLVGVRRRRIHSEKIFAEDGAFQIARVHRTN